MKTFNHQDNLYDFPYHYLPSIVDYKIYKPFKVHYWLYNYVLLINFLKKRIESVNFDNFLDYGCGDGRLINNLKINNKSKLFGFEISEKASLFFKAFNPEIKLLNKIDEFEKYQDFFNIINFSEVIEHIPDDEVFKNIENIHKILKKDGILLVTAPHENNPVQKKHYRHYNYQSLLKNFDPNKFRLVEKKFLFKKNIFKTIIRKFMFNRFFIVNSNLIFKLYFYLNNFYLDTNEKSCETIFLMLQKK